MLNSNNPEAFEALQWLRENMTDVERENQDAPAPRPKRPKLKGRRRSPAAWRRPADPGPEKLVEGTYIASAPSEATGVSPKTLTAAQREQFALASRRLERSHTFQRARLIDPARVIVPMQPQRLALLARSAERTVSPRQHREIDMVRLKFRSKIRGLTREHVQDSLLRITAALPAKPLSRTMFRDALRRDLRSYLTEDVISVVADEIMGAVSETNLAQILPRGISQHLAPITATKPERFNSRPVKAAKKKRVPATRNLSLDDAPRRKSKIKQPVTGAGSQAPARDVPVVTMDVTPKRSMPDADSTLRTLQNTDLVRDFAPVVDALIPLFRILHSDGQPHATRIFLDALDNRFALVVPRQTLQKCRSAFRPTSTTLDDVQRLPTTHGLVIQERGAELTAWTITPEYGEAATVKLSDLQRFLGQGTPPRFSYEVVGSRKSTNGLAMRDLASFASTLRSREPGIFPLTAIHRGQTSHEWTERQMRRMGEKNAHRVREHLRKLPTSGDRVVVHEHARYGMRGLSDTRMRIHLL